MYSTINLLHAHACTTHIILSFLFVHAGSETDDEEEVEEARAAYYEQPGVNELHVPLQSTNDQGDTLLYLTPHGIAYRWPYEGNIRYTVETTSAGFDTKTAEYNINPQTNTLEIVTAELEGFFNESYKSFSRRMMKAGCTPEAIPIMFEARQKAVKKVRGNSSTNKIRTVYNLDVPLEETQGDFMYDLGISGRQRFNKNTPLESVMFQLAAPVNLKGYDRNIGADDSSDDESSFSSYEDVSMMDYHRKPAAARAGRSSFLHVFVRR